MVKVLLTAICSLMVLSTTAHAISIEATVDIVSSSGNANDADSASSGAVAATALTGGGVGTADATDAGVLASASSGGYSEFFATSAGAYSVVSRAVWSDAFSNPGASAQTYQFDFLVPQGLLASSIWSAGSHAGEFNSTAYSIDILFDGNSIWSSSGSLSTAFGASPTSTFGGTSLGGALTLGAGLTDNDIEYAWAAFNDTVFFSVAANSSADLAYVMRTEVNGNLTFGPGEFCGAQTPGGRSCAALASIADPFDTSVITAISPVPLPGALWLFGSGLLGLLSLAHRKT